MGLVLDKAQDGPCQGRGPVWPCLGKAQDSLAKARAQNGPAWTGPKPSPALPRQGQGPVRPCCLSRANNKKKKKKKKEKKKEEVKVTWIKSK
ncbi:hypothetical protein QJS10_CPB13g00396 [Acorus calamus]|uniref:Uncharacterized protein n=1 Tax=Acorus calamus TaxID=4465 RepID=A0AAV9DIP8_ACOCL|nr:hypothetical protein QJS10_CPB13g00396 [Acorus calamus]